MARPEIPSKTALGARLRELRKILGDPERDVFAAQLGVSKTTLGNYEKGETEPTASVLDSYRKNFRANLFWIVTGLGDRFEDKLQEMPPSDQGDKSIHVSSDVRRSKDTEKTNRNDAIIVEKLDLVMEQLAKLSAERAEPKPAPQIVPTRPPATVTYLPFRASAGGGSVVLEDSPGFQLDIDELSQRILGMRRKNMRLIEIIGDSMLPTFMSGDVVVADTSFPRRDDSPDDNEIYVISKDGELLVKRAMWTDDGVIEWRSDNLEFTPLRLERDEINQVKLIGKVVWLWRRPH